VENIIFLHLKQRYEEIYFHANGGEIDFIIKEGMNITQQIQVTFYSPTITKKQ